MRFLFSPALQRGSTPSMALLLIVTVFGTLAMHIVIPVLPTIAEDLGVSPGPAQLIITIYLVGVSFGQLIYGPLSDRFGRRPILLVGLVIYVLSMVAGALAPALGWLLLARVGQALGGSCALVLGRAMVRDGAESAQAASRLAMVSIVMSLSPAVAPLVGAYVAVAFGWRMIFGALGVSSLVLLLVIVLVLPETNRNTIPLPGARAMWSSYMTLLRMPQFLGFAIGGATSTSFYAFLSASPFIFTNVLHRTPQEAGLIYLPTLAGFAFGSFIAMRLARRYTGRRMTTTGNLIALSGPVLMLACYLADAFNLWTLLIPMTLFTFGTGLAGPFAQAGAVGADLHRIGAASGLYGFMQMMVGALCTLIVGSIEGPPLLPMILVMLVLGIVGQIAFRFVGRDKE
jgi:DHA1 family bicyclomycin/chloramphenicol resistance-like MFS transporter